VALLFNGQAEAGKSHQAHFNTVGLAKGLYFSKLTFNEKAHVTQTLLVD
jgi:hypothetical protein